MGLTITYRFEFKGSKAELIEKLVQLRSRFQDLPVRSVGDIVEIKRASLEFGYGRYQDERFDQNALGFMMAWTYFEETPGEKALGEIISRIGGTSNIGRLSPQDKEQYLRLQEQVRSVFRRREERIKRVGNGVVLSVDVGEGCEYFTVMLGRFRESNLWRGTRYTKTQYAEHFVTCHTTVIKMLDLCNEAGILNRVSDEGGYWESRDLEVLAKNINKSTDTIRAITSAFKGPAEKQGFRVKAPIEKSANYLRVRERKFRIEDKPQ
jgi:hypothetical protein